MKNIVFLLLTFSSFLAISCEDEIKSIGGAVTDGKGDQINISAGLADSSGMVGTDCVLPLPPIQAVITYIPMSNWLGGSVVRHQHKRKELQMLKILLVTPGQKCRI